MTIFDADLPDAPVDEDAQLALIESRPNNQAYGPEDRAYLLKLVHEKRVSIGEYDQLLIKHGEILRRVANALNGEPAPLTSWSHHDLGEKAEALEELTLKQHSALMQIKEILDNQSFGLSINPDTSIVVESDLIRTVLASIKDA